jgi:hypothetical protein
MWPNECDIRECVCRKERKIECWVPKLQLPSLLNTTRRERRLLGEWPYGAEPYVVSMPKSGTVHQSRSYSLHSVYKIVRCDGWAGNWALGNEKTSWGILFSALKQLEGVEGTTGTVKWLLVRPSRWPGCDKKARLIPKV